MFEMIGLVIGTTVLFALASLLGLVLAGLVWLLVRRRSMVRLGWMAAAFALPVLAVPYLLVSRALLPGKSLFGDIDQPLPNGYWLEGLGKMPDYSYISRTRMNEVGGIETVHDIASLSVEGPVVLGAYRGGSDRAPANAAYFLFDTRTQESLSFPGLAQLEQHVGHPVTLSPSEAFRSRELPYRRQQQLDDVVQFGSPTLALLLFAGILLHRRRSSAPLAPRFYT